MLPSTRLQNQIKEKIIANDVFGVTFTSSSTVENFFKFLDPKVVKKEKILDIIALGQLPLKPKDIWNKAFRIASKFTIDNLLEEIIKQNEKILLSRTS